MPITPFPIVTTGIVPMRTDAFTIDTAEDAAFYGRVYHPCNFPVGDHVWRHGEYYVVPHTSSLRDLERIRAIRTACGMGDANRHGHNPNEARVAAQRRIDPSMWFDDSSERAIADAAFARYVERANTLHAVPTGNPPRRSNRHNIAYEVEALPLPG